MKKAGIKRKYLYYKSPPSLFAALKASEGVGGAGGITYGDPINSRPANANPAFAALWRFFIPQPLTRASPVRLLKIKNPANTWQGLRLIVEPEGFEPSSKQAITILSTCLVSVWFSMCT